MEFKNVIIAGAAGTVGPHVLKVLRDSPGFNVSILTREDSSSAFPSEVTVRKTDYSLSSLVSAFTGQDVVVCAVGGEALGEKQKAMIDAALKAGVKRFIPGEFGSSTDNPKAVEMVPLFQMKKDTIDYLQSKEKEGMTWTGIICGGFFDWGVQNGFLGYDLAAHKATIYDTGKQKVCLSTLPLVGKAVAAVLMKPKETANKFIRVASFNVSQREVVAALEKASGSKWETTSTTSNEAQKVGKESLQRGDIGAAFAPLILSAMYSGEGASYGERLDNNLLGLPKENFEETVKMIVDRNAD
ncbi:hypothetical protein B0A49_13447 [Cryomyces minteri]|uniref:NmrA-like domain-containing protein n=1 Tax=Cryomyces minteri TaxID=331657 RepID=A0A4U0VUF0_9PEZI|nr:hypothetical protein B0A49_13447 [Cryomyces minteri]